MVTIDLENMPCHIAIIMDGNGRWAENRGNSREIGHRNGVLAVKRIVSVAAEIGLKYLTLYTFSTENWMRPKAEVTALMSLLDAYLNSEIETLERNNVRLLTIGDVTSLPVSVQKKISFAKQTTSKNSGLTLVLALSYSSKQDIVNAVQQICKDVVEETCLISDISEEAFKRYISTANIPDPELLIRTSGEYRISNFLLWEISNTELYFTNTLWPDFDSKDFYEAILDYQCRGERMIDKPKK